MKGRETEFVGRIGRFHSANAPVSPIAERSEEGDWQPVADAKVKFPPQGMAELVSALAFRLREGDLVLFRPAPANIFRPAFEYRAIGVRKVIRLLDKLAEADAELGRRMLVEDGLEQAEAGEYAVRVGADAVARVTLSKGSDGRYRAEPQARLALRRYDPKLLIDFPEPSGLGLLYDFEAAEKLPDVADWSRDVDFLVSAARSLPDGEKAADALSRILRERMETLTGRVSAAGGHDPAVAAELLRARGLEQRLRDEGHALSVFAGLVHSDPVMVALVDEQARSKAQAEMPALAAAARADVEREMEAARTAATERLNATISELEVSEMAALQARLAERSAQIDAEVEDWRRNGYEEAETSVAARRAEIQAEAGRLEALLRSAKEELDRMGERKAALETATAGLADREAGLLARIETLTQAEESLEAKARRAAHGRPRLLRREGERTVSLDGVGAAAKGTSLLTPKGIEAVTRFTVMTAAREIPVVVGEEADDFLEVVAMVLAAGRVGKLAGDPTTITLEDLWSRPGGNGPTALGDAAEAAGAGMPTVGVVVQAELSGARFWLPPLRDAYRRGGLPDALMLCLTVEDRHSDEGQAILAGAFGIEAVGLVDARAAAVAPVVFSDPKHACSLAQTVVDVDPVAAATMLATAGADLSLGNARRLARLHAAAARVLDEASADAMAASFIQVLNGRRGPVADGANTITFPSRAANA